MACFAHLDPTPEPRSHGATSAFTDPWVEGRFPPSWTFRIAHVDLRLSLHPDDASYRGEAVVQVEPLPGHQGVFRFDLDGPTVDAVTTRSGEALPWRMVEGGLEVTAPADVGAICVRWHGSRPRAGLYFVGPNDDAPARSPSVWTQCQDEDAHLFLPCHDHPRARHPWTIELEGPAGWTLLSNGRRVDGGERNGRSWAKYAQDEPMPVYLLTAVAAPLEVVEASPTVRYLVPPGHTEAGQRSMGRTPEMIARFEQLTGVPYPWSRYDQVVVWDFSFGGMENTGCTTMTDMLLVDERSGLHWPPEGLVAHELAHQWFGDLVTCADWSQAWLNEGFATFMEVVWFEHAWPADEAAWYAFTQLTDYLAEDNGRYRRPIQTWRYVEPVDVFDHHLYEKGALVLRTLRAELGETAFWAGVRRYLTRHAHGSVHTWDLQRAMEDASGASLERFFQQWTARAGHPALDVTLGEEDGLVTVGVTQRQSGPETTEVFALKLPIEIVTAEGTTRIVLPVRERSRTWAIPARQVELVRVDPGFTVLADVALDGPRPWLAALSHDADPVLAVRALRGLAKRAGEDDMGLVRAALAAHPFWGVRAEAAALCGKRGSRGDREALLARLAHETEPRARLAVATALGAHRDAADGLLAAAAGPTRTWHEQGGILLALGQTRDPRAVPVLVAALSTPSWGSLVTQRALAGLAATEREEVLPHLIAHATPSRDERIGAAAAAALGVLGLAVEKVRKPAREALERLAHEGRFRARLNAVQALGKLGQTEAIPVLEAAHRGDPDGRVRRYAGLALKSLQAGKGETEAVGQLRARVDALQAETERLRERLGRVEKP